MDEKYIQQLIKDALTKSAFDAQFNVVPVPAHAHTGVDSSSIDGSNLVGPVLARVASFTSTATPQPPANSIDLFDITALGTTAAFQPPYGQAFNGSLLRVRITSSNVATARALTWSTATGGYLATTPALPAITTTGLTTTLGFEYDTGNSINKWRLIYSSSS